MRTRRRTKRHLISVVFRRQVWRRLRRIGRFFRELPHNEADLAVRNRRDVDEIRAYYPDYRARPRSDRWY